MSLQTGAEMIVHDYMDVGSDELVLIMNDGNNEDLMHALIKAVSAVTENYAYIRYPEPAQHVADYLLEADVGIAPTTKSISHTRARLNACKEGARVATLPGITKQIWNTSLQAEPERVRRITEYVMRMMEKTHEVRVKTPSGTDLTLDIKDKSAIADTGIIHDPHSLGNLPPGEVGTGIVNAKGTYVIDDLCPEPGKPAAPQGTKLTIEDGIVTDIDYPENQNTSMLEKAFRNVEHATNVAEFGIGTNPAAELIGNILQDEKTLGTIHIAFGDSASYIPPSEKGGVVSDLHWDAISVEPTVTIDGTTILEKGEPLFLEHVPGEQ